MGKPRQTGAPVSSARLLNDAGSHSCGDFGRPVIRVAIDNDDLSDEIGGQIGEHTANRLRFIVSGDDDRH